MLPSKKETKKINLFTNLFASSIKKRAIFFVFLVVLVLGFSANISFAVLSGPVPAPGSPISPEFQQMINNTTGVLKSQMMPYVASGSMPTSPSEWGAVLKYFGGYSQDQINAAGIQYSNQFVPTGHGIMASIGNALGITDSDQAMLDKWKNGQNVDPKPLPVKIAAAAMLPNAIAEQTAKNYLASKVWDVVIGVLSIIAFFLKQLITYAAQALDMALNPSLYSSFASSPIVVKGWTVVRDVCNLFFLIVLLFIAICTILKIEKYHAKKTLLTLIIMALLINFSKPIAVFIFDGSQLLMNFFLSQMGPATGTGQGGPSTVISKSSEIANLVYNSLSPDSGSAQIAAQYLFAVVFLFMLGIAFLVTALMLIIRIVAVMLLIIVSPLAFFAAIIPDFSKMSSQWWSALFEYSYYGPAAAFFLLLATQLEDSLPHISGTMAGDQTTLATVNNIIHYATVLIFLYASIIMAKKFGGVAGAAIVGNANRFMKWGAGMSKGGGLWGSAARGTAQVTGAANMYKGVKAGIGKQPYWRYLTKEGREAASKESQEKWEGKVAPFSMADARKKAKEEEFKDQAKVDAGITKGNAHDLLIGSKRGTLTDDQLRDSKVQQLIASSPELRKEMLGNLRDKGQTHMAAYLRYQTRDKETDVANQNWTLSQFGEEEINSNKKLGDMDWDKVTSFSTDKGATTPFRGLLLNRLNNMAETNAQGFLNTVSNLDGKKINFIKDTKNSDFGAVLTSAQERAGRRENGTGSRQENNQASEPRVEVASDYRPRSRTTYDDQGRPIT